MRARLLVHGKEKRRPAHRPRTIEIRPGRKVLVGKKTNIKRRKHTVLATGREGTVPTVDVEPV